MTRKLLLAASIIALACSSAAQAEEEAYSITCPDRSDVVYTVDPVNGRYAEIGKEISVYDNAYEDKIVIFYEYGTNYDEGYYIDLETLALHWWYKYYDYYGPTFLNREVGDCQLTDYVPIEI